MIKGKTAINTLKHKKKLSKKLQISDCLQSVNYRASDGKQACLCVCWWSRCVCVRDGLLVFFCPMQNVDK